METCYTVLPSILPVSRENFSLVTKLLIVPQVTADNFMHNMDVQEMPWWMILTLETTTVLSP